MAIVSMLFSPVLGQSLEVICSASSPGPVDMPQLFRKHLFSTTISEYNCFMTFFTWELVTFPNLAEGVVDLQDFQSIDWILAEFALKVEAVTNGPGRVLIIAIAHR